MQSWEQYDLEIDKLIESIKEKESSRILLQLPDGLKPAANYIQEKIKARTDCKIFIWAGSNFGSCDIPMEAERLDIDLIVAFGHSKWVYDKEQKQI